MLWLFFVVRKTLGDGFGTYLIIGSRQFNIRVGGGESQKWKWKCGNTHHAASTSSAVRNLMRAWRICRQPWVSNDETILFVWGNSPERLHLHHIIKRHRDQELPRDLI